MNNEIDKILSEMFSEYDVHASEEVKEDFWNDLSDIQKYSVNDKHLRVTAKPEYDYLTCWEPGRFDDDEYVTDYDTMYDVDYNWWKFQMEAEWEHINDNKKYIRNGDDVYSPEKIAESINKFNERYEKYSIYLNGDWYRLIENDVFIYSQFISAKWYLYYKAEEFLDELSDKKIPHTYKDDDILSILDETNPEKKYNANGREYELEEFKNKIFAYQRNNLLPLVELIVKKYSSNFSGNTFRYDRGYDKNDFDPFSDFIFFDEQSLKNVSPKQFLKTFKNNQLSSNELDDIIDELQGILLKDFNKIYKVNKSLF